MKELSRFKRYLLVLTMLSILFGLLFWMFKRIMLKREEYKRQIKLANEQRHAKVAIMEEQKDKNDIDMEDNNSKQYNQYLEYSPLNLWDRYSITKDVVRYDKTFINDNKQAQVELLMYYQSFVKLFRIIILRVTNLELFLSNDTNLLKVKVLVNRSDGTKMTETSQMYPMSEEVAVDEKFSFRMEDKDFTGCILYVTVWRIDVFYKELLLGAISIDLSLFDHSMKMTVIEDVLPVKKDKNVYGYVLISLCHLPSVERLVCVVMNAKNLKENLKTTSVLSKAISPYVKVSLLNDGKLIKTHKTSISTETREPVYNEMMEFYVPCSQITSADLLLVLSYKDDKSFGETIGKVLIGNHAEDSGHDHWKTIMQTPEQSFAMWHPVVR